MIAEGNAIRSTATGQNRLSTLAGTHCTANPKKHRELACECPSYAKLSGATLE